MVFKLYVASALAVAVRDISIMTAAERTPPLVAAEAFGMELREAPIEPSWILSGQPRARLAEHSRSADEAAITAVWDCSEGSFRWHFKWDETVIILEGAVHVLAEDGSEQTLKSGDIAYFKGGTWATWTVETYVKKIAFVRKPFPAPVALAWKLKNLLMAGRNRGALAG